MRGQGTARIFEFRSQGTNELYVNQLLTNHLSMETVHLDVFFL